MIARAALAISVLFAVSGCSSKDSEPKPKPRPAAPWPATAPVRHVLRVTGVEPPDGKIQGHAVVLVRGEGFIQVTRAVKVYFGTKAGRVLRITGDDAILVEAPDGTVGETVDLLLIFEPGGELKLPGAFTFVAAPAP